MAKTSLKSKRLIVTAESFSLPCSEQIGNNKKHWGVIKKQLTQPVFSCTMLN